MDWSVIFTVASPVLVSAESPGPDTEHVQVPGALHVIVEVFCAEDVSTRSGVAVMDTSPTEQPAETTGHEAEETLAPLPPPPPLLVETVIW